MKSNEKKIAAALATCTPATALSGLVRFEGVPLKEAQAAYTRHLGRGGVTLADGVQAETYFQTRNDC